MNMSISIRVLLNLNGLFQCLNVIPMNLCDFLGFVAQKVILHHCTVKSNLLVFCLEPLFLVVCLIALDENLQQLWLSLLDSPFLYYQVVYSPSYILINSDRTCTNLAIAFGHSVLYWIGHWRYNCCSMYLRDGNDSPRTTNGFACRIQLGNSQIDNHCCLLFLP